VSERTPIARLPRSRLRLDAADADTYGRVVDRIQHETLPTDAILALPNDAELYFLANRRNPFRFYNSALGIRTQDDLSAATKVLSGSPPRIVTFRPDDKYNTAASRTIMADVRSRYDLLDRLGGLEVYRRRF
jgi:hypothetical protein